MNMKTETIYCPANLPINFKLGLADAHTLLDSFKQSLNTFEQMYKAAKTDEQKKLAGDVIVHLKEKMKTLQDAIDFAKRQYAKSVR
jgi:hypothetical protein